MNCKKAIGVAEKMKEKFGEKIDLKIHTVDSEEAKPYNFRSATNVVVNKEVIPINTATEESVMEEFLRKKM